MRIVQFKNCGVTLEAESMQFSTSKHTNPVVESMAYIGIIEEIWEVDYTKFFVPVFKCKWVDNKSGLKIDESGFTLVDFRKIGYRDEPWFNKHLRFSRSKILRQNIGMLFYMGKTRGDYNE